MAEQREQRRAARALVITTPCSACRPAPKSRRARPRERPRSRLQSRRQALPARLTGEVAPHLAPQARARDRERIRELEVGILLGPGLGVVLQVVAPIRVDVAPDRIGAEPVADPVVPEAALRSSARCAASCMRIASPSWRLPMTTSATTIDSGFGNAATRANDAPTRPQSTRCESQARQSRIVQELANLFTGERFLPVLHGNPHAAGSASTSRAGSECTGARTLVRRYCAKEGTPAGMAELVVAAHRRDQARGARRPARSAPGAADRGRSDG